MKQQHITSKFQNPPLLQEKINISNKCHSQLITSHKNSTEYRMISYSIITVVADRYPNAELHVKASTFAKKKHYWSTTRYKNEEVVNHKPLPEDWSHLYQHYQQNQLPPPPHSRPIANMSIKQRWPWTSTSTPLYKCNFYFFLHTNHKKMPTIYSSMHLTLIQQK